MLRYDLIIIGGGPAGTSAAISAARSGASVLLFERGRFPRHKVCGEFVSPNLSACSPIFWTAIMRPYCGTQYVFRKPASFSTAE